MADQASGYLQRKMDEARRNAFQEKLAAARDAACCNKINSSGDAGANSGYLNRQVAAMPVVYSERRGGPPSILLQQCIDKLEEWDRVNDRFKDVAQRRPIPICTTPPNTIYNAGLPVPVPKFPCVLVNNMTTGS